MRTTLYRTLIVRRWRMYLGCLRSMGSAPFIDHLVGKIERHTDGLRTDMPVRIALIREEALLLQRIDREVSR